MKDMLLDGRSPHLTQLQAYCVHCATLLYRKRGIGSRAC